MVFTGIYNTSFGNEFHCDPVAKKTGRPYI